RRGGRARRRTGLHGAPASVNRLVPAPTLGRMGWVSQKDIAASAARVLPWLGRDPAWNSVASTVLVTHRDGTVRGDDPWLARLPDGAHQVVPRARRPPP